MNKTLMIVALAALTFAATSAADEQNYSTWAEIEQNLVSKSLEKSWAPMRDGVRLDTNIYLPKEGEAPYPTVLIRSPYLQEPIFGAYSANGILEGFLENGYAIVFQNERGRYWSEGMFDYMANAREDGYDAVDWLSKQEWSNGKIGTIGCSSSAENQLGLAASDHPAHGAAIAQAPGAGIGHIGPYREQGNIYRGGALQLLFASWSHDYLYAGGDGAKYRPQFPKDLTREERVRADKVYNLQANWGWGTIRDGMDYNAYFNHLPVADLNIATDGPITPWERFATWTPADERWKEIDFGREGDIYGPPMLWVFSWYDVSVAGNIALYNYATENSAERSEGEHKLIVGPGVHCVFGQETENTMVGARNVGDARFDYMGLYVEFFDYWLKGERNRVRRTPPVQYYLMGRNEWVEGNSFPLEGTEYVDVHLDSDGGANGLYGNGRLSFDGASADDNADTYVYDPLLPVPTHGGGACCQGDAVTPGAFDQRKIEMRNDVLVYTSEPLKEGLNVAGFVEVELYVSSDAADTDFTLKLIDVYPDGTAYNLDDNIFRARYREGYDKKVLMEDGEVYKIRFAPMVTANYFKPGHSVRLEVSSSNFPRYGRNLNTGGNNFDESEPVIATNSIHHSSEYPSVLRLPVVND